MKVISYLLLFLSAVMGIAAVDVQKSFIVSFDQSAPQSALDKAKQMVIDAKGSIDHEYTLIR